MPISFEGSLERQGINYELRRAVDSGRYDYDYPDGLDLKPGSELHTFLVEQIKRRARDSHRYMSRRHSDWREIDKTLRAYVHHPEKPLAPRKGHRQLRRDDPDQDKEEYFERLIMPVSYANLETLLTYMTAAFIQEPIFRYRGNGPNDVLGGMLLEKKIDMDCRNNKVGLALHTHWRDGFAYGAGVVHPRWMRQHGYRTTVKERGFMHFLGNMFIRTERKKSTKWQLTYEGGTLDNIDPYRWLPDPRVPAHEPQAGEFQGWVSSTNHFELLSRERDKKDFIFNTQYLKHSKGVSVFIEGATQRDNSTKGVMMTSNRKDEYPNRIDVIWMYIKIIPSDWKLGKSKYPEKWLFGLAADEIIVAAQPLDLDHDMFPVAVCAPDFDGYSAAPVSKMLIQKDLQELIDFLYSSHIMNVRKAINDSIVVDPEVINIYDVQKPGAGKIIRVRRSMFGRASLDTAIKQLAIQDVTQGNIVDAEYIMGFMDRLNGGTAGISEIPTRGPRISATMARTARTTVMSKLEHLARIIDMQSHADIAKQMASNTQQLMEHETFVEALGEWAVRIREDFGVDIVNGRVKLDPLDLIVPYDVIAHTGAVPGSQDPELWMQLAQIGGQIPQVAQSLDWPRLFKHISRQLGATNVDEFFLRTRPVVMEDEMVEEEVRKGNAVPASQVMGDGSSGPAPFVTQ
jgi:hypothetical protein